MSVASPDAFWVVIPAAGQGQRMASDIPKQYQRIAHRSVLEHTLSIFLDHPKVRRVVVALSPQDPYWPTLSVAHHPLIQTVVGGQTRAASVLNGLNQLAQDAAPQDWVLVHDAARPCLAQCDLKRLVQTLFSDPVGGLLGLPVKDTLKIVDQQQVSQSTLSRSHIWAAQTPQMFRLGPLRDALEKAQAEGIEVTDEASAMEYVGAHPKMVLGSPSNLKITYPADLALAAFFLQERT